MEDTLKLAKTHGVYLSVGEQHRRSEASCAVIMKFLADMIALDISIKTNHSESVETPAVVKSDGKDDDDDDEQQEDHEEDESDNDKPIDEDDARVYHLHEKISILGKRGFQYNPVCRNCKMQFDLDDNKDGSCICHEGDLTPDTAHEWFWEWEGPYEEAKYDGDSCPPDAFYWSCCDGSANAKPCKVGKHQEDWYKRPRF
ncbi:hypothetical protein MBLNU457_g0159t1 [Dothideomycetes sp. NU457]